MPAPYIFKDRKKSSRDLRSTSTLGWTYFGMCVIGSRRDISGEAWVLRGVALVPRGSNRTHC
jgi:hypothetical protein